MVTAQHTPLKVSRRQILLGSLAFGAASYGGSAFAADNGMESAIKAMFGPDEIKEKNVSLTIPALSENGFSVPFDVEVESPMTDDDHVTQVAIFSERNPIPLIANFHLTPRSGRAKVEGRIRLAGTQNVHAIAKTSDGKLYRASANSFVTVAACIIL